MASDPAAGGAFSPPPRAGAGEKGADSLRNICILAHVDHGKTTCADNLICSNGIISRHSAGKIRYMDSRVDEQERQITMKSSSISLRWTSPIAASSGSRPSYTVNLIDSPGHVDFTSEVSMAARLADGALVVIDVVEGVAAQTRTVLRQAWRDRVKTCLLLNKVDRLFQELELTPLEAYQRLVTILEQVNAVNQQLLSEELMAVPNKKVGQLEEAAAEGIDLSSSLIEFDLAAEEALTYSPERGNVAFGSASHGWAFNIGTFARLIAGKLGAKPENLQKVLWGEWFFNKKTKRVQRRNPADTKTKPMFVEFILQQVFGVYEATHKDRPINMELLAKMQSQIPGWKDVDFGKMTAGNTAVRELMSRWLPFAESVLQMSASHLPSPAEAAENRLPVLCPRWFAAGAEGATGAIAEGLRASDLGGPVVVYLAKFLAADLKRLVLTGDALVGDEEMEFVAVCRVFSGTMRRSSVLHVCREGGASARVRVERLFTLMGRFLEEVQEAFAGSVVAAHVVLEDADQAQASEFRVERCLTLCDAADGPTFETPYSSQAYSIVRVSIQPTNVGDLDALDRGLRLLHRADPSVSVEAMVTGENVLGCCGDEHLKRCITDLQKVFAPGVALSISKPLVAVRESFAPSISEERADLSKSNPLFLPVWLSHLLVDASTEAGSTLSGHASEHEHDSDAGQAAHPEERIKMSKDGIMSVWTPNRKACIRVGAVALPDEVLAWMDEHAEDLETVVHRQRPSVLLGGEAAGATLEDCMGEISRQFDQRMGEALQSGSVKSWSGVLCGMSVIKASRAVLIDATDSSWSLFDSYQHHQKEEDGVDGERIPPWMRSSVLAGFKLAAAAGPMCEEPMRGVAFVLHGCQSVSEEGPGSGSGPAPGGADPYGPMSGQVMVAVKEACRYCLFRRGFARICEAMLSLEVNCEQEVLGKVYGVLGKRRVKVLDEGLRFGTSVFYISCHLPLADSFGIAQDLRQAASGHVSFHAAFSHWELQEEDPFHEASLTQEELEENGDQSMAAANMSRKLIDAIRKRKGLPTDEKVVANATKQRTLSAKK